MTFDVGKINGNIKQIKHLIDLINSRVRLTDVVGWLDNQRVGVLLTDTSSHGANVLAKKVSKEFDTSLKIPDYRVYTYPSENWIDGNGNLKSLFIGEDIYVKLAVGYKLPFWKRAMDIIFTLIGLLVLSPIFLIISIIIKTVSSGPVFFKQERVGRSGKIFTLLKFRTMEINNDISTHRQHLKELIKGNSNGDTPMEKLDDESRIIPMG